MGTVAEHLKWATYRTDQGARHASPWPARAHLLYAAVPIERASKGRGGSGRGAADGAEGDEEDTESCGVGNDLARVFAGRSVWCCLYTGVEPLLAVPLANQWPERLRTKQAFDIGLHTDVVHPITVYIIFFLVKFYFPVHST